MDRGFLVCALALLGVPQLGGAGTPGQADGCLSPVRAVANGIPNATVQQVRELFGAFASAECESNAEFGEQGNEVLFRLIERQPALFVETLFGSSERIQTSIGDEIRHPMLDGVACKGYHAIEAASILQKRKARALALLRPVCEAESERASG